MVRGVLTFVVVVALVAPTATVARAEETDPPDAPTSAPAEPDLQAEAEAAAAAAAEATAKALRDALAREREAERGVSAARAAVDRAEERVGAARLSGQRADGSVRAREEVLPPLLLSGRELETAIEEVEGDLARSERRRAAALDELDVAREALERRALRTFKTGRSSDVTGPLAVIREARDPGELVRSLTDLRAITRDGARAVRDIERELDALAVAIEVDTALRDELIVDLAEVRDRIDAAEADAAAARQDARAREAAVVDAMAAEVAARRALDQARSRLADAVRASADAARAAVAADVEVDPDALPGPADGEPDETGDTADGATLVERESQAAARRRAHERAARLGPDARRATDDWACPVADASFVNDWAFPRSGARRHEGTDVFAARGTPIVAVASGTVTVLDPDDGGPRDLGGVTVSIANGPSRQYYAHLERIADDLRLGDEVEVGHLLGYVGTTGNARGTPPHLHLGWYVDDVAVNPYASLAVACADQGWRLPTPASTAR